jgi:polar amino acid transport system ATP-binding protein
VHLSFGANQVLKGIDLDVQRGQAVSIIGPSGSGKSTILRCITGLLQPAARQHSRGRHARCTRCATEAELIELRKRVGFVFQQYNLFPHLSVLENLVIAPHKAWPAAAAPTPKKRPVRCWTRCAWHKADAYPGELSGGQQQRVAIARALAMRPS